MSSLVTEIKKRMPIMGVMRDHVLHIRPARRSGWYVGHCPFHQTNDDRRSKRKFWVSSQHNLCGCFVPRCPAYCNQREDPSSKPMDVINFYARLHDLPNRAAIFELADRLGLLEVEQ